METANKSPLTQMIEDADASLKNLVTRYSDTVTQLQHLQQLAQQLRDEVLVAQTHHKTLVEVSNLHTYEPQYNKETGVLISN